MKVFAYWSGGKDAAMALHIAKQQGIIPLLLVCRVDENNTIAAHQTPLQLIQAQARASNIPLLSIAIPAFGANAVFEEIMGKHLQQLKNEGYTHALFGDLFLEELKNYHISLHRQYGIECVFPLWGRGTKQLATDIIDSGIQAVVASVNTGVLAQNLAGSLYTREFIGGLLPTVDPCGENGEFHTFVYNAPFYNYPLVINVSEDVGLIIYNEGTEYQMQMAFATITLDE